MDNEGVIHTDPVCGMEANEGISAELDGEKFFFCSSHCMGEFAKDPTKYVK